MFDKYRERRRARLREMLEDNDSQYCSRHWELIYQLKLIKRWLAVLSLVCASLLGVERLDVLLDSALADKSAPSTEQVEPDGPKWVDSLYWPGERSEYWQKKAVQAEEVTDGTEEIAEEGEDPQSQGAHPAGEGEEREGESSQSLQPPEASPPKEEVERQR